MPLPSNSFLPRSAEPPLHYSAKNNLNRNLTTVGSVTTIYSMFKSLTYTVCAQKPDICRCIYPRRDRLGFYAEIQFIFGPLYIATHLFTDSLCQYFPFIPWFSVPLLHCPLSITFLYAIAFLLSTPNPWILYVPIPTSPFSSDSLCHYLTPLSPLILCVPSFPSDSLCPYLTPLSPLILCVPILSPLILCVPTSLPFLRPDSLSLPFSSDSLCPYLTLLSPLILCVPIPPTISKTHPVWLLLNRGPLVYIKAPDCRRWMG